MKTKKTILKFLKILLFVSGSLLIIFAFFQVLRSDLFKINQVICFQNETSCEADLWFKVNGLVLNQNIIRFSPSQVEKQIKESLPEINQVEIKKRLPDKIIIRLTKRKPMAIVEVNSDYFQTDYMGIVLAELDQPSDLPLVVPGETPVEVDKHQLNSETVLTSLDFLYQLLLRGIEARRMEIAHPQETKVFLKKGEEVIISLEKNIKEQVDSLQLILTRAKIEGKQILKIDLRFDKPVINYSE